MYGHFEARYNSQTSSNTKASAKYVARLTCIINFQIVFLGVLHVFFLISPLIFLFSQSLTPGFHYLKFSFCFVHFLLRTSTPHILLVSLLYKFQ